MQCYHGRYYRRGLPTEYRATPTSEDQGPWSCPRVSIQVGQVLPPVLLEEVKQQVDGSVTEVSLTMGSAMPCGRGETLLSWTVSPTEGAKDLENYVHIHKNSIPTGLANAPKSLLGCQRWGCMRFLGAAGGGLGSTLAQAHVLYVALRWWHG